MILIRSIAFLLISNTALFGGTDPSDCNKPRFFPHPITENGEVAVCYAIADLDGDGDPDLLTAFNDPPLLAWQENADGLGDSTYQYVISRGGTHRWTAITAADVDGDGHLDVVAAASRYIWWYRNSEGNGNFVPAELLGSSLDVEAIIAADIDSDGDEDLVVGGEWDAEWIENIDGRGSFGNGRTIAWSVGRLSAVIDIDRDGDLDVISGGGSEIHWLEQTDGIDEPWPRRSIATNLERVRDLFLADLDGDGD